MSSCSSVLPANPIRCCRLSWSLDLGAQARGVRLAREKGWTLVWDEGRFLHLFNRAGSRQARTRLSGAIVDACCADDGSAYVSVGGNGEIWWLAPDLTIRWQSTLPHPCLAAATDPFGHYLAVTDTRGGVCLFDRHGRQLCQIQSPRPLHYLAFIPALPLLVGAADYGLVICHDLNGKRLWRDGLVAHIGSLATAGAGERIALACFSAGLQCYTSAGSNTGLISILEACRLAAISFDGRLFLVAGLTNRLFLVDDKGRILCDERVESPIVALALGALGKDAVLAFADGRVAGYVLTAASF